MLQSGRRPYPAVPPAPPPPPSPPLPQAASRDIARIAVVLFRLFMIDSLSLALQRFQDLRGMLGRIRDALPMLLHDPIRADPGGGTDDADGLLAVHHFLPVGAPLLHRLL